MPDEASAMLFKNDAPVPRFVEQGKSADTTAAGSSKTRKPIILGSGVAVVINHRLFMVRS